MSVVIVGHGLSLRGARRGAEIDSYDKVCRIKRGWALCKEHPLDYGTKMDYICSTLKTWVDYWTFKIDEFWGYQNFPGQDGKLAQIKEHFGKTKVRLEEEAVEKWLEIYRGMSDVRVDHQSREGLYAKEGDEPWFSTGMGAIVIAAASARFKEISLIGFDNMSNGSRENFESMMRIHLDCHMYPNHAWDIEKSMIPMVADHYGVEINFV